jgi:hypothetical protein
MLALVLALFFFYFRVRAGVLAGQDEPVNFFIKAQSRAARKQYGAQYDS